MSGIFGIVHRGGALVEPGALLQRFADFMAYRGPDAQHVWSEGPVGFGHALLRATFESAGERQPAILDSRFTITADVRLDAREELATSLASAGRPVPHSLPDALLLLHAYAAWGADCVAHLRGDFAFAIWDAQTRTLFCARDHFGIKPFYYAELGDLFLISNTLNCVRLHPAVSEELNEAAIADFLLFGLNYNNATTTFRDVQRLPPAHTLAVSPEGIKIRRYWTPPTDGRIRYRHASDYVDHFNSLLQAAVKDRLRTDRVGILMSGGLDSPALAATAKELSIKAGGVPELYSYTAVYESLIPDNEGPFAREVAEFLRIPNRQLPLDHVQPFEGWDGPNLSWPEPVDDPLFAGLFELYGMAAKDCRVVLYGEGSDNLMYFQMWPYVADVRRRGEWKRLLSEVSHYFWIRPFPWRGIRSRLQRFFGKDPIAPVFPNWIAPDFARRLDLEARWKECSSTPTPPVKHPIHPKGHASMFLPHWTLMFELQDAGVTRFPLEVRYPFLDLRLVDFLLAIPPFPFFFKKKLIRDAMTGRLPESVRMRAKTPLRGEPVLEHARKSGDDWANGVRWNEEMPRFIILSALGKLHGRLTPEQCHQ
ncbi:MAG: lasso peptide isopeptide bond-forming cyclase [Candidatus Acidiferrum sp.]